MVVIKGPVVVVVIEDAGVVVLWIVEVLDVFEATHLLFEHVPEQHDAHVVTEVPSVVLDEHLIPLEAHVVTVA